MLSFTTFQKPSLHVKTWKYLIFLVAIITPMSVNAAAEYFVDAHSQVDTEVVGNAPGFPGLQSVYDIMTTNNVDKTILSTRGSGLNAVAFAYQTIASIVDSVRSKSKFYNEAIYPTEDYITYFSDQADSDLFNAASELLIYHAAKTRKIKDENGNEVEIDIPEVVVPMNSDKVQYAVTQCVLRGWPTVIHIEFAALEAISILDKKAYMAAFELLLDTYPDHPFVLIHMGQLEIGDVMRLIMHHDNVYFLTSHADPVTEATSQQPWTNLFKGDSLAPHWRNAFIHFPTRFIFALDNVFAEHWYNEYNDRMYYWNKAMNELPNDVANLIAHGNAERLWFGQ